jgi:iduronate 2-sulfatase
VPSKYFDLYQLDDIQVPPFAPSELQSAPRIAYDTMNPNYGMSPQQHREAVRAYYAAISFVDAQVGRLVDALQKLDLAQDTTIVFWADHGFMVGEHGQWEKMKLFEPSARVPFFMAGAGVTGGGRACYRTSEHLNIYPTLAELCQLQGTPSNLQGRSLVPLLQNPDAPWDHPAITQVTRRNASGPTMGYSVRTERYRYTMWSGGADGEELYDYQTDPHELKNLANDSSTSALKARLRSQLQQIAGSRGMNQPAAHASNQG